MMVPVIMRCALGGDIAPTEAVSTATGMIERAVHFCEATHLVITLDSPGVPSWRKVEVPRPPHHMKLTIPRPALLAALAAVKPIAARGSLPILSNLLLVANGNANPGSGSITLTASDLDLHLRVNTEAAVSQEGKTTVRASLLFDIIRMAEGSDVRLELKGSNLTVECGAAKHWLTTIDPADFPPFPRVKPAEGKEITEFALEDAQFRSLLAETSFAASMEEERFILCGNLIKLDGADIYVVACDGHRIAVGSVPSPIRDRADLILPVKTVRELLRLLGSDTAKPGRLNEV